MYVSSIININFFIKSRFYIMYDYVIVGGGPCGLTLAFYLQKNSCIIDSNSSLGGCYRVFKNSNNQFSEHSPRVYSDSNIMFKEVLSDMGIDFHSLFTPYNYSMINLSPPFNFCEYQSFFFAFLNLMICPNYGKETSMYSFTKNFKKESIDYISRVCKL